MKFFVFFNKMNENLVYKTFSTFYRSLLIVIKIKKKSCTIKAPFVRNSFYYYYFFFQSKKFHFYSRREFRSAAFFSPKVHIYTQCKVSAKEVKKKKINKIDALLRAKR